MFTNISESKKIICIRHGKTDSINHYNNSLSETGIQQCNDLFNDQTFHEIKKEIDLVVISPLNRTIETANIIFKNHNVPCICLDELVEFPQSNDDKSLRLTRDKLKQKHPHLIFYISNQPFLHKNKENNELFQKRLFSFKNWLFERNEKCIAIVGHNSFFKKFLNQNNDFKHCNPYFNYLK